MKPLPEGMHEGEAFSKETLDKMLGYYCEIGRNTTRRKLKELELGYVEEELAKLKKLPNNILPF